MMSLFGKNELKGLVDDFYIRHPEQISDKERFLGLLKRYDDNTAFTRTCFSDGHFTGSMLVTNKEKTKVLLMHHIKLNIWVYFGGHADGDMNIPAVAMREFEEESGIPSKNAKISPSILNIDIHKIPEYKGEPFHYHYDVLFLAVVDEDIEFVKQDVEVHEIKWFDIFEILENKDNKYLSGLLAGIEKI